MKMRYWEFYMKILFYGNTLGNNGPCNVNKGMVRNLTSTFWYAKSKNKYMNMAEAIMKCLFSDAVVISGISKQGMILMGFSGLIRKSCSYPTVYVESDRKIIAK